MLPQGNYLKLLLPLRSLLILQLLLLLWANMPATTTAVHHLIASGAIARNMLLLQVQQQQNQQQQQTKSDEEFVQFLKYVRQEQNYSTIVLLAANINDNDHFDAGDAGKDTCVNMAQMMAQVLQQPLLVLNEQQQYVLQTMPFNNGFLMMVCMRCGDNRRLLRALSANLRYQREKRIVFRMPQEDRDYCKETIMEESLEEPKLRSFTDETLLKKIHSKMLKDHAGIKHRQRIERNVMDETTEVLKQRKKRNSMGVSSKDRMSLQELFRYCQAKQMLNVIAVSWNFPSCNHYYSYTRFPRFRLHRLHFDTNTTILFPNRLLNLEGYPIRTLPDQYIPRSWVYVDHTGHQQLGGYCAHFLKHFARHLNASLAFAKNLEIGRTIFYADMLNYTRGDLVDIPVSIMGPINDTQWAEYSYPYELTDWCVLLPMEPQLTQSEIYSNIASWVSGAVLLAMLAAYSFLMIRAMHRLRGRSYQPSWCDILLNDKAWRGVFGQSFAFNCRQLDLFVKWVFFLLFVTGLTVSTVYSVILQSYMTHPPQHHRISSFADMNRSPLRLFISHAEYALIYPKSYEQFKTLFTFAESFEEFRRLRQTPNASFGYPMTSSLWSLYRAQQQHFSRPLVRYSRDLCFVKYYPLFFLLPVNSIYRDVLHLFILRVHQFGLSQYWMQSAFSELVALGRISYTDGTVTYAYRALSLPDVVNIMGCLLIMLALSVLVFAAELLVGCGRKVSAVRV